LASARRHCGGNHVRITSKIETSEYDNSLLLLEIKQAKRESTHDRPTYATNGQLIKARAVRYVSFDPAYFVQKQAPHALPLPFLGSRNVDNFAAGHLPVDDR
jgi:hypothetical protein